MSKFEDRLLLDLMDEHGDDLATVRRPARRRSVPRPALVAAGATVLAGAALAGTFAVSGGGSPAYAVTKHADGTVTVSLRNVAAVDDANARLRELGVPVRAVRFTRDCTDSVTWDPHAGPSSVPGATLRKEAHTSARSADEDSQEGWQVTVSTRDIPNGDTLLLAAQAASGSRGGSLTMPTHYVRGAVPSCLPTDG